MEVLYRESIPRRPGTKHPRIYKISEFPEFREIFFQIPNIPGFPGTITSYIKAVRITSFLSTLIFFFKLEQSKFLSSTEIYENRHLWQLTHLFLFVQRVFTSSW